MTNQGKAVFILLLISLRCIFGDPSVEMKLARAKELLRQLATKSVILNEKVRDVQEGVSNLKCGFDTLKDDVTVLETARDLVMVTEGLEQHDNEAASQLLDLLGAVEKEKERVRVLKEFTHPCGHGSWKRVEYLDFRDAGTACPPGFASNVYNERPYTCSHSNPTSPYECDRHTINVNGREYTRVCGRVRAYQFGSASAFEGHITDRGINEAYVTGVSLTHGGDLSGTANLATHIWSFAMGLDQIVSHSTINTHCPCDGGSSPPDFVGEDYFCEAAIEQFSETILHPNNVLWDGENCGTFGDCCTRLSHPFFVKQLEQPTTDDIDFRLCTGDDEGFFTDVALELVEIYIQ